MSDHLGDTNKMVGEDVSNEQMTAHATPNEELRRQILSHVVPKNEREWWAARAIERLEFELNASNDRIKRLEEFARTIENDFDHDEDAHRYGTTCRVCDAEDLLKETKAKEAKP